MNTLIFPTEDISFAQALDGEWKPERVQIDEDALALEIARKIQDDIEDREDDEKLKHTEYCFDKRPFEFLCAVYYKTRTTSGINIQECRVMDIYGIELHCYWDNEDIELHYNRSLLASSIEMKMFIPIY